MADYDILTHAGLPRNPPLTVQEGSINSETLLELPGEGLESYGEIVGSNLIHMLENFAGDDPPALPPEKLVLVGQLWFDTQNGLLKVWSDDAWQHVARVRIEAPTGTGAYHGQLLWNPATSILHVWDDGSDTWKVIGPYDDTAVRGRLTALEGRMTTAEGEITAVKGRTLILENRVGSIDTHVVNHFNAIAALQTRDTAQHQQLSALEGRAAAVEGRVATLEAAVPDMLSDIADLQAGIETLRGVDTDLWNAIGDLDARIDALQTSTGASGGPSVPANSVMLFYMNFAPPGWTQSTAGVDDSTLRVVANAADGGAIGGNVAFSTVFANNRAFGGSTDTVTVAIDAFSGSTANAAVPGVASHTHGGVITTTVDSHRFQDGPFGAWRTRSGFYAPPEQDSTPDIYGPRDVYTEGSTGAAGGGSTDHSHGMNHSHTTTAHSHAFSVTPDFRVRYANVIICSKNS